ncbi:DUF4244 domain-containing protein [Streptomyces sp. ODS28]|uniref:DUF4244 domain-containing protein n=1 Tax=Streptomyces sp. ODS28 TaxID=3136688 RepID=UPI0031ED879F
MGQRMASTRARAEAAVLRRLYGALGGAREAGMSTAEYAVGTLAACAFAAVLYKIVTSGTVSGELQQLIGRALHAEF